MNLFNLVASITLDSSDYDSKLSKIDGETGSATLSMSNKWKKLGTVAVGAMATLTAAAGAAVLKIGKDAMSAYANYEQLEGGVKKLYGNMGMSVEEYAKTVGKSVDSVQKDWERNEAAQALVMENAKKAFETTGLSANAYMEQATSFSAALINSLGGDTEKAAKQTDVAMRAIADNYNTFGGDMGMIQYAFQGFAKQNYTMLDNLKLGYGGTKTEMERLISDANKWAEENGKAADLSIDSFSDVVTAIDYIQQKQNIAGTTAREASTTIAGSVGMVKAAYENLVSGLANPDADISELVSNLVGSIGTAMGNVLPAIEQFASGFGQALTEIGPALVSGIPDLVSSIGPTLIDSVTQLMGVMVQAISTTVPQLLSVGEDLLNSLIDGISNNSASFIASGMNLMLRFSEFIRSSASRLVPLGLNLIKSLAMGIIDNIPTFIETVPTIIENFANVVNDNAPKVIKTGVQILKALAQGIVKSIPVLISNFPKILKAMVAAFTAFNWINLGRIAIKGIAKGLKAAGGSLKSAISKPINNIKTTISEGFSAAKQKALSSFDAMKQGIKKKIESAKDAVKGVIEKIKGFFPISIGKWLSNLPSLSITTATKTFLGKTITYPTGFSWHAKAMENPYMFTGATLFGAGEAGDEMLYGKRALMDDITEAMDKSSGKQQNVVYNITIENADSPEEFAQRLVRSLKLEMRTV